MCLPNSLWGWLFAMVRLESVDPRTSAIVFLVLENVINRLPVVLTGIVVGMWSYSAWPKSQQGIAGITNHAGRIM